MNKFRDDFIWGAATAAYQIEGAADRDGKGKSIWDMYCRIPGKIKGGHTGEKACMHYDLYKEDIRLMKELGINAYRFSISWPRIFPEGTGRTNQQGIDFYNRLLEELLKNGIEPYITLYHWDLPYELYLKGGWMNRESVDWFAEYAAAAVRNFSDKAVHYFTFNEPQCFIGLGFGTEAHAPGITVSNEEKFLMAHHVMMAHGKAVQAMRAAAKQTVQIGYAPTCGVIYPASEKQEDIEAAKRTYFGCTPDIKQALWSVSWWSDPVILGKYPEDGMKLYERYLPDIRPEDLKLMNQPLDIYGQNIYNGIAVSAGKDGETVFENRYAGFPRTANGWPVTPEALYWGPKFLYERYRLPLYITENGMSCHDWVSGDGKVHDPNRIDFTAKYLHELKRASSEADIRGYFHWSLMDNFEWADGYTERFGLIYIDYRNQERIPKDSFYWYQKIIAENGGSL